jgi:hypothetical protein
MLREKETYNFRVLRRIVLPDDTDSWVLTLDGDDRYLLPAGFYTCYGLSEGMVFRCRVDKINCTGRIYLEPEHPDYREGEHYRFTFVGEEHFTDRLGNRLRRILLQGHHGERHDMLSVPGGGTWQPGAGIDVLVQRIKKGRLILDFFHQGDHPAIVEGGRYLFRLGTKGADGFIPLEGPGGLRTTLRGKVYREYGLHSGETIWGYLVKWDPDGIPVVEPEHPLYVPGGEYPFPVVRTEPADGAAGSWMRVLVVADCFGGEIKVAQQIPEGDGAVPAEVWCRVERMKKGLPVLRIAD